MQITVMIITLLIQMIHLIRSALPLHECSLLLLKLTVREQFGRLAYKTVHIADSRL